LVGYRFGKFCGASDRKGEGKKSIKSLSVEKADTEDEEESLADGDLAAIKAGLLEPCKMVCFDLYPKYLMVDDFQGPCCANRSWNDSWKNSSTVRVLLCIE